MLMTFDGQIKDDEALLKRIDAVASQGYCGCCGDPFKWPYDTNVKWDHCHTCGSFRCYLCTSCNHLVGRLEAKKVVKSPKGHLVVAFMANHQRECR